MQNKDNTITPMQISFGNGWTITVHGTRDGEVYYQQWAPGVTRQSYLANLARTPIDKFWNSVADAIKQPATHAR